jgi:hypothetical protein
MTWKGLTPIVTLSNVVYEKGISLKKSAMKEIEKRLIRNPEGSLVVSRWSQYARIKINDK